MKKLKVWYKNLNTVNLLKAEVNIMEMFKQFESINLSTEEQIRLKMAIDLAFLEIVSKKKEQALKDFNLCEIYEGKDLTKNASKIKVLIHDENFDKPIEKLTKNY